jgi:hypothetical protein
MRALVVLALSLAALPAAARDVQVPLRLEYGFLEELLVAHTFTDPERTARIYTDGVDCNRVTLLRPELGRSGERLRVKSEVDARFGTLFLGYCLFQVEWQGTVDSLLEPSLAPNAPIVRFRVVETTLVKRGETEPTNRGVLWEWLEAYAQPRFELLQIDLATPMRELSAVLPLFLAERDAASAQALVASIALERPTVTDTGMELWLRLTPPERAAPLPSEGPAPALTPEELARLEEALARWDGFVTYVVKQAGEHTDDSALREQLLEVLLRARYRVLEVLESEAPAEDDPVRPLFLETWQQLADVLRALGRQLGDRDALHYLGFVASADALAALDALGPDMNIEISSDGLRRLARVLAPDETVDPLATPDEVDPELRRALGFDAPLPAPEENPEVELEDGPELTPELELPEAPPEPAPLPPSSSSWQRLLAWLRDPSGWWIATAHAATLPPGVTGMSREDLVRLNQWVPNRSELAGYLPLVRSLLRSVSLETARAKSLPPAYHRLYSDLQLATAWQETCWRQYVRIKGAIHPIRSRAGALGLMQVNARAWRGFYDSRGLGSDIAYNSRAGSEILLHYLLDLAIERGEHKRDGGTDNLVRATYGAYNGGPSQLARYRAAKSHKRVRAVDTGFFQKYEAVRNGRELEVARCFG